MQESPIAKPAAQPNAAFRRRRYWIIAIALVVGAVLVAAIVAIILARRTSVKPPPRVNDPIEAPRDLSMIAVPLEVNTAVLSSAIENGIPRTLWSIDQTLEKCVEGRRVRLFKKAVKVTPDLGCTITGTVTRSAIRLRGEGEEIIADVPITANISARNVGGVLDETATGSAMVRARIRIDLRPDWTPVARVRLAYAWTQEPGVDFLGQRITFAERADEKLQPIVRDLERTLPREIAKLNIKARISEAWRQSFTSLSLNEKDPPVWMRITPQQLSYGGYRIEANRLQLRLGLSALTETFVGPRPADPPVAPLPPLGRERQGERLQFFIPVIADYAQLEPVILRALIRRSARPFDLPGLGPVVARFEKVTAYGTTGGQIALGLTLVARPQGSNSETHGIVWITARPVNAPGSQRVSFEGLAVNGDTDGVGGDVLVQIANSPGVSGVVSGALTQNFTRDFQKLLGKVERAIVRKRAGDFVIRADIGRVRTGALKAGGQGLYLPVWADGTARVEYVPGRR